MGLKVGPICISLTRYFSKRQDILLIIVYGLPIHPKPESLIEITKVFQSFGKICDIKYHCFGATNFHQNSCTVLLDISNLSGKSHDLPRRLEVFGKFCDLFWHQALPFCRYCKSEGHFIKDCLLLQSKNTQKIDKNSLLNVISSSATNISLVVLIDLPQSIFRFEIDIPPKRSLISGL